MQVAVLYGKIMDGATEDEQDVLVQADAVSRSLGRLGFDPVPVALSLNLAATMEELQALKPAFVFNLLEAIEGKGNLISCAPLILDTLRLPYTGASAEAMFLTSGKIAAKQIMRLAGIATPDWWSPEFPPAAALQQAGFIIKSVWEHASCGLDESALMLTSAPDVLTGKIRDLEERLGGSCFAEAFIEGREFNVSLLAGKGGPEVLPPAEIIFAEYPPHKVRMVCYRAKWVPDSFEYNHTPRSFTFPPGDAPLLKLLADTAVHCWNVFRLRGYARVDFRVDNSGRPWVLEVNANPCLSPDGGFTAAAARAGLDYDELIARIIKDLPRGAPL